jgi:AcrR family transcriptional regulator
MPRPRSDIRPRILTAARDRFLRDGVDGASLRAIARDARTNIGMIYYYFPTKDDLFLAVVEHVYAKLLEDIAAVLAAAPDSHARLRGLYGRIGAMSDDELVVVRLIVREALGQSDRLARIVERFRRGHVPLVVRAVAQGVAAGELSRRHPLPVLVLGLVAAGVLPQIVRRMILQRLPELGQLLPGADALAGAALDLVLHGAASDPRAV